MSEANDDKPLAVVTGVNNPVGMAIAVGLLAAGWCVAGWAMEEEPHADLGEAIDSLPGADNAFLYQKVDVRWIEEIADAIVDLPEGFGTDIESLRINALINAEHATSISPFMELQFSSWETVMDINAKALLMTARVCVAFMANAADAEHAGTIINIVGSEGHVPECLSVTTNAAKAAALMITRQLALELTEGHVTTFSISPTEQVRANEPGRLSELIVYLLSRKDRHKQLNGIDIRFGA